MVVLMEEFHGLTLKRKGAEEPELFDAAGGDDRSGGFPLSCRATKMRRLACPENGGLERQVAPAAAAGQQDDVPMCDDEPALASAGGEEEEGARALVLYGGGRSDSPRVALRGGAEWLRAMLREADSRTVRELLAGAAAAREHGSDGLALAVVPWVPPPAAAEEETEPTTAADEAEGFDDVGAAAMDVEEDEAPGLRQSNGQAVYGSGAAEGFVYRWPQHCMAPPQMPPVAQPSPVMWSW
ncbi:unnamed protein product [Urochloa decumbens]|uniref:Uncharacterized protein n=1 Tax=Urochloa decumbens TaxID=240449 RepID=A0ABC9BR42_9POAL